MVIKGKYNEIIVLQDETRFKDLTPQNLGFR